MPTGCATTSSGLASMGVTATPFILANGYAALTGLHPTPDYLALLRGAAVA